MKSKKGAVKTEAGQQSPTVKVKGYGSLKGMLVLRDDIDLTKPIAEQVFGRKTPRRIAK